MDANHHHPDMEHTTGALFPPLGQSPQQRAKTAHTTSSLPIAGNARVSTHPLLPPHHIRRRNQVHLHLHKQPHRGRHHARNKTDSPKAPCSMTDHIVGLYDAPELPEIEVLLRQGAASRATIVQMIAQGICRTSFNDVQRFPAIHPSIMSARKDRIVRYITFVSAPPFERRAPKDRPKSWDRRVFKPLGPEECFHCQLQTNHAVCERHKYLRVGGGFRHSYSYIKQTLDVMEAEHRKVAEEVRKRYEEEQLAMKAKAQTRRKIKMYVKGADGKIVSRYLFVTEDEYEEMKKDSKLAKKILGLADDEELDDWVSSKQKYVMDENGQLVKVSKKKYGDSAYEESMESGVGGRSRRNKGRHHGAYSDSDSFESGMGHSILEGDEADRRRRRRHGRRRYSSVESIESYVSEGGTRRERTVRRRRRRRDSSGSSYEDENGNRRRRHRRRRRRGSGSDSGTELDSNDSRSRRHRHRKGRHRGRHRDGDSDGSYDSYDSRDGGGRRRRRRGGRRRSDSSGSDDSRSRRKGRRHRRRYSSSYSDESGAEGGKGRRRKGGRHHRHRRGHSSGSSDYSDSEDSRGRRRRRHRRHHRDGSGGGSYTDGSLSYSGEDGDRRHHRRGRRHRRRHSGDDYSGSDEDGHRRGRRHRRRYSDESGSGSGRSGDGHRRRRRHRRRHSGDSDGSRSDDYESEDDGKGGRRRRRRRRRRSGSYSDSYSYSDGDGGSAGHGKGRRRRRHRRRHSSDDDYSDDDMSYDSDDDRRGGRRRKGGRKRHGGGGGGRHGRKGRRHSQGGSGSEGSYSDGSSYDSYDDSSVSLSDSSVVSDASTPSSVNSSDISDIDSNLDEDERIRIKAEKKAKKMLEKRAAKQQLKEETRKEAREVKRDKIRAEVKEQRREERRERRRKEKRRRQRTPTSRDISDCSSVSSVNSDDISDVDSALVGEERRLAKEAKKAKKKAQKKEMKQKEKVKNVQEQHREKRKEKERQRIKREIEREMDRMSTPSDVSSVHSSDLSSVSDEEGLTVEEKQARKEERKKKKKEEKMKEKKLMKAVNKVMEKRKKKGRGHSGSSDDSYARGKQDFYDLTSQVVKSMVKYSKGGKRGLVDEEGSEWLDDWKNQKTKDGKKKKGKKGKAGQEDGDFIELTAPDGRKIRVPKTSLFDVWNMKKKIRLKKDGTVARDSDSDAESIEIDSDGNMVTQPKTVTFADTTAGKWTGFAATPEPPLSPTQGGKIKFQGVRKVQHAFRKDRGVLTEHLKRVLDTASELSYPRPGDREEARRGYHQNSWESIDFLNHYRLVEGYKLDPLGRAFVVEDVDYDCTLTAEEMRSAIEGVPSLSSIKPKQLEYVLRVLNIDEHTDITFKMFAVISGVCERMCNMDSFGKYILDKTNLLDIARKMALYKNIFYCNVNSERSVNHITSESLQIELIAGGLSPDQERYIMSKMNPDEYGEISFFDYMAYIPLFLSMHENIIDNPLDRHEKFTTRLDYGEVQRDMNPMGLPLQRGYLGVPKEIFPSGIPPRSPEDGATREFIERGDLLEDTVVGGKSGRLPSIGKKTSAPISAKHGGRMKDLGLSMSMP